MSLLILKSTAMNLNAIYKFSLYLSAVSSSLILLSIGGFSSNSFSLSIGEEYYIYIIIFISLFFSPSYILRYKTKKETGTITMSERKSMHKRVNKDKHPIISGFEILLILIILFFTIFEHKFDFYSISRPDMLLILGILYLVPVMYLFGNYSTKIDSK